MGYFKDEDGVWRFFRNQKKRSLMSNIYYRVSPDILYKGPLAWQCPPMILAILFFDFLFSFFMIHALFNNWGKVMSNYQHKKCGLFWFYFVHFALFGNPQRGQRRQVQQKIRDFWKGYSVNQVVIYRVFFLCCVAFLPIDENLHGCGISTQQDLGICIWEQGSSTYSLARTLIPPPNPPPPTKKCVCSAGR